VKGVEAFVAAEKTWMVMVRYLAAQSYVLLEATHTLCVAAKYGVEAVRTRTGIEKIINVAMFTFSPAEGRELPPARAHSPRPPEDEEEEEEEGCYTRVLAFVRVVLTMNCAN
jgi:hypothetical protein